LDRPALLYVLRLPVLKVEVAGQKMFFAAAGEVSSRLELYELARDHLSLLERGEVERARYGLRANWGFINLAQSRPKVKFSKRKVKEKDREYSSGYRECSNKASTRGGYDFLRQQSERALLYSARVVDYYHGRSPARAIGGGG